MADHSGESPEVVSGPSAVAPREDEEAKLAREVRERVDILTAPGYQDKSVVPLSRVDYVWLAILCGVIPLVLVIWGWYQF
jgi:hypothetical protein